MAEEGQVISCHTVESWNEQLQKGIAAKKLIVVDFTASWCPPCKLMSPILSELAKKLPAVIFLKSVAEEWAVEAMPTFVLTKEGKVLERIVGAKKDELQLAVEKHATVENATTANA
ncbi:Thioredoxin H1 [Citrus sinensis]|nr:Thioredoxin H1 [Citrus sinensis]